MSPPKKRCGNSISPSTKTIFLTFLYLDFLPEISEENVLLQYVATSAIHPCSRLQAIWKFRKAVPVKYGSTLLETCSLTVLVHSFSPGAENFHFPVGSKFKSSLLKLISLQEQDPDFFPVLI